jgi:uncharacterized membrane protein
MKPRYIELDLLRGFAIIGMIIIHTFVILDVFEIYVQDFHNPYLRIPTETVRFIFLFVVGVSMTISFQHAKSKNQLKLFYYKQFKRASYFVGLAILISLITYYILPSKFIAFGILHLIGTSILLTVFLCGKRKLLIVVLLITYVLSYSIKEIDYNNVLGYILGFRNQIHSSIDYFPILRWIWIIILGILAGDLLFVESIPRYKLNIPENIVIKAITFIGRNTLIIYILHTPIIVMILMILGFIELRSVIHF